MRAAGEEPETIDVGSAISRLGGVASLAVAVVGLIGLSCLITLNQVTVRSAETASSGARAASVRYLPNVLTEVASARVRTDVERQSQSAQFESMVVDGQEALRSAKIDDGGDLEAAWRTAWDAFGAHVEAARNLLEVKTVGDGDCCEKERSLELRRARLATTALDDLGGTFSDELDRQATLANITRVVGVIALMIVSLGGVLWARAQTVQAGSRVAAAAAEMVRAIRRVGRGDMAAVAPSGRGDLGRVGRAINEMVAAVETRVALLQQDADRGATSRRISEALDSVDDESGLYEVVRQAFGLVDSSMPAELLVIESGSHLERVASNPALPTPGCPVTSSSGCPAIRHAQTAVFESGRQIDACPHFAGRAGPDRGAVCVPVYADGRALGVVHTTSPAGRPPTSHLIDQIVALGSRTGSRLGALRTLAESQHLASTDPLTGLLNRRAFEAGVERIMASGEDFVLVLADLDRFKNLNDTFGHEEGDRALQVFASVLVRNIRGRDIAARFGGEEFVLVYPGMSVGPSMEVIERIRLAFADEVELRGSAKVTASFGVTHSSVGETIDAIVRVADAGLLMAKEMGRDRVVYADERLAEAVFAANDAAQLPVPPGVDLPGRPL